jgi:choline/glycine/proline betaine transport protein
MLFAAGMGIGLVYFGVAEPVMHYADPLDAAPLSEAARVEAMRLSFFHWGPHAWGVFAVLALAVAHAHFNRGLPLAPRSALAPLLGERVHGPLGAVVDVLAVVGTLLGVATSLGLGAMQIDASLNALAGLGRGFGTQAGIVVVVTAIATLSVVLGVSRGVQRLSQLNLVLAGLLLAFVFLAGPTLYIVELLITSVGDYLAALPRMSLRLDPGVESEWQTTWTLFCWGWWISWSPFVAIFVARISKGRTVGEFVAAVLLVPSAITFLWFAAFGGTGIRAAETGEGPGLVAAVERDMAASLEALTALLPASSLALALGVAVIALFFVTSSDSGSLIDGMVARGGDPNPPREQRVFWAVSEGAIALVLLWLGGLSAIRNAAIGLGLPMSLLLLGAGIGLWRTLSADPMARAAGREVSRDQTPKG